MLLVLLFVMGVFFLSLLIFFGLVNLIIVVFGVNYGFCWILLFVIGVIFGFILLLVFVGFWFVCVIEVYLCFFDYLGMVGVVFIVYVGYCIVIVDLCLVFEENGVFGFF